MMRGSRSKINQLFKDKKLATAQFKIDNDYEAFKNKMIDIELEFAKIDLIEYFEIIQRLLIKNKDLCIIIRNLEENYSGDIELLDENREILEKRSNKGFISRILFQGIVQELIIFDFLPTICGVRYKINQKSLDELFPKLLKRLEINAENYKRNKFELSIKIPYETLD